MAVEFAADLLIDPATRGATDIIHLLSGIASSRSSDIAKSFLADVRAPSTCQAFASYVDLVQSPAIDVIYVATPHSHHFQHAMLALEAGKHVLCEKSLTVNAAQARRLVETAQRKQRFLMEGMWTRFLPVSLETRRLLQMGAIGAVTRILADNSLGIGPESEFSATDRLVVKELAGGALLDRRCRENFGILAHCSLISVGVYSLHWVLQALPTGCHAPSTRSSVISKLPSTGVDETVTILMKFPNRSTGAPEVQAVASASLRAATDVEGNTPAVRIQGDDGELQIHGWPWNPSRLRLITRRRGMGNLGSVDMELDVASRIPKGAEGLCYEADEVARCIQRGDLQSPGMSWEESLLVMELMDAVRRGNGLQYPDHIESAAYPLELPSKPM